MMSVLQPIAYDVLECLTHLFDYYLYAVSMMYYDMLSDLISPCMVKRILFHIWNTFSVHIGIHILC